MKKRRDGWHKARTSVSYQHDFVRMGHRQGGKWPQWISLLKTVIEGCCEPLHGSVHAVAVCWEELTEKQSAKAISVQATNIGQQITTLQNPQKAAHEFT